MERTPAGQLLIDTHKQAKKMPCNALHWASLRTYTPFAISALNLIYIHFIIFAFSATPTRLRPALPYPTLPCPCSSCLHPFEVISGNRPWLFFLLLLFRVALMNSNVCVIELLKFHWTAPACLLFRLDSWEAFKRRFPFESGNIFTFLCILIYGQVQCNLSPEPSANGVKMKHDRRRHTVDSVYPVESCDSTSLCPFLL